MHNPPSLPDLNLFCIVLRYGSLAAAAGPGCGAEPLPTPVEATYGPSADTILTPFPSDRYTVADASSPTGRRVRLDRGTTADPVVTTFPKLVAQLGVVGELAVESEIEM
mgnify:CR=1 FL=1